jgi:hypothetical protein
MEERIYQGHVYRRSGPGQPWQLVGPAQQPPQSGAILSDPNEARDQARKDAQLGISQSQLGVSQSAEARQQATLPYDVQKAQAEATIATSKAAAAAKEQAAAPDPAIARVQNALKTDSVLGAIGTARRQIDDGWSTGNFAGTGAFQGVPWVGQNSANLHATLSGIQGSIINDTLAALKAASANGASGYGSLTETEAQRLSAAVGALQQTQDSESLKRNLERVERHYRNALALLNNEDPRQPEVAKKYGVAGMATLPPSGSGGAASPQAGGGGGADLDRSSRLVVDGGPGGAGVSIPTGATRMEADPARAGVNNRVNEMMRSGKSAEEIYAYLNKVGVPPGSTNIPQVIDWRAKHPEYGGSYNVDIENRAVPMSGTQQMFNQVGSGPVGATTLGAADAVTLGTLDNLTSNPEITRAIMGGIREQNPTASLVGEIGGGTIASLAGEAGLARLGLNGLARARAGDALFGAAYGAGSTDDPAESRIIGALMGGAAGVAGGMAGRAGARTLGRVGTGVQNQARILLDRAGVRMTPGQVLGGTAKSIEDKLTSIPFLGDAINARRGQSIADFNRTAFDQATAPIGQTTGGIVGEPGIDIARVLRGNNYDEVLGPVRLSADEPFETDMRGVIEAGRQLPEPMRGAMDYTLPTRVGQAFDNAGNMTGREYQQALRGLRGDASAMENLPFGHDFGGVTRQAEGVLEGLLERQSPGTAGALRTANEVNRNVETLREAVNAARSSGSRLEQSGMFMPSQLSNAASANARRFGNAQGTTNQPFYDLTRAGQEVLPSAVPDSGTAGRYLVPAIAGSLAGGGSYAAQGEEGAPSSAAAGTIAALLAAAPYSNAARATLQRMMLAERPAALARAGQSLYDNNRIAGLLAAPAVTTGVFRE